MCSYATPPAGYVPNATDCNDANAAVHAAYYHDADGDGYGNAGLSPSATAATPPAGYVVKSTDCDDTLAVVHPGASDASCDGVDNNCNLQIDEGFEPYTSTCGVGACASTGYVECLNGVLNDSCVPGAPSTEICNGIDDNCDGTVDNAAVPTGTPSVRAVADLGQRGDAVVDERERRHRVRRHPRQPGHAQVEPGQFHHRDDQLLGQQRRRRRRSTTSSRPRLGRGSGTCSAP